MITHTITYVKPSAVIKVAFGVLKLEEKYTLEQDDLVPAILLQECP